MKFLLMNSLLWAVALGAVPCFFLYLLWHHAA